VAERILLIEDDPRLAAMVSDYLGEAGFRVTCAANGKSGLALHGRDAFDAVVLDLMLPDVDGLEVCRQLRAEGAQTPILMLTARGDAMDRVVGLEMGADDYLPKPFHLRELLARVKSVLRRASSRAQAEQPSSGTRSRARFAGWHLDLATRELLSPTGGEVRLTTGEFDLLAAFVNNANQVLSRDRLLDLARNREAGPFDRTIDVQVGRLRRKLEPDPAKPTIIKTVRGTGYIFTPTVEVG
jgi:two-component system, OmpR family, response regulator